MVDQGRLNNQVDPQIQELNHQIEQLQQRLRLALQEKNDLEAILATVTHHSDQILDSIEREKTDLEILLENTTEHSSQLESELQHQVEEERRQREEQFQLITAATPVGLLISQIADGQILYANQTIGAILELSPPELLNYHTVDFYMNPMEWQTQLNEIATQQKFQGELLFKQVNGSPFWVLISICPFVFRGVEALLIAITDINDRKQAEEALRLTEAKYRGIFENAIEGIFRTSLEGRYLEVNPAMAAMFGYAFPDEMTEAITDIALQVFVNPNRRQDFELALATQGEIKDFEYQVYHRDGSTFWVSEWARVVQNAQGASLYYEGSCIDITKRKQQEDSLRQQVRKLQIEIDQSKRIKTVAEIEQTDYFQWLMQEADNLRHKDK
ncbi:PAS domain S-box protein [Nostoc sp. C052]|uniref:PAS domain-containing protein n=1 Tax=Nostoc sp. C052 TaxID=2576902 RepID=UPI0015C38DD6|nr:PAS domain-containing protein [Nostoc sp. C052]QLE40170.1 PAS domain S-box protein [Nostoc sp. C052]